MISRPPLPHSAVAAWTADPYGEPGDVGIRADYGIYPDRKELLLGRLNLRFDSTLWAATHPSASPMANPGSALIELFPRGMLDADLQQGQRMAEDRLRGQSGLFGDVEDIGSSAADTMPNVAAWPQTEVARREKAAIGFYLSTHPAFSVWARRPSRRFPCRGRPGSSSRSCAASS